MQDGKIKQKSQSKPIISKKKLPKEFFEVAPERFDVKSPKRKSSKETTKLTKVLKHLDKMPDQSTEKLFQPFRKQSDPLLQPYPILLEEMITLSQTSSSDLSSTVRKVIHCKTLNLFSVKQIPISKRQERESLKDWAEKWKTLKNPNFVKIIETFWNVPEGCVSIVSEYRNAGSLLDLSKTIGTIPEKPLSRIAKFLVEIAQWMEDNNEKLLGLSPSQILFDRNGSIKLSSGISKKVNLKSEPENTWHQIGQLLVRAIYDEQLEIKQKNCCFLHSIDPNPILSNISPNLEDFLCGLTRLTDQLTGAKALAHPWLSQEEYFGADVDLAEIIGIGFKGEGYWGAGELQLNRICEALKVVLMGRKFSKPSFKAVECLARELGVPDNELNDKLMTVYKELNID